MHGELRHRLYTPSSLDQSMHDHVQFQKQFGPRGVVARAVVAREFLRMVVLHRRC